MKLAKRIASIILSCAVFISLLSNAASAVNIPNQLSLNILAVNCYSGNLSHKSKITVQYSDADLGRNDEIKMYAKINQISTGQNFQIEIGPLNYKSVNRTAYESAVQATAQDKMGIMEFYIPESMTITEPDDYNIEIWSLNSSNGQKSSVSINKINCNFEGADSDWDQVSSSDWLRYIDGSQLISQINLPGTHDSASVKFSSLESFNKCQDSYIDKQLTFGVRYLDIRVNTSAQTLSDASLSTGTTDYAMCHASYNAKKSDGRDYMLSDAIKACYEFLDAHPSEFIYFNVQQDNNRNDGAFQSTIHEYIAKNPDKWFVKSYNPTLNEVRGKLVYARRFEDGNNAVYQDYIGGTRFYWDALENTSSNQNYVTGTVKIANSNVNSQPHEIVYHIQDYYKVSASNKWTIAKRQLDNRCDGKPVNEYFYNALNSAATLSFPSTNADKINGNFSNYELITGDRYGWIIFDFVTEALAKKVYSSNIKAAVASDDTSFKKIVLHYNFDNLGTNLIVPDLSGNGFDGYIHNSQYTKTESGYITLNNSGKKRESGAGIDIPSYAFRGTNNKVTLSVWMNPQELNKKTWFSAGNIDSQDNNYGTLNNWGALITQWEENGNTYGPRWAVRSKGCGESMYNADKRLVQNKWQLLTYVMDGAQIKIYIDGALAGEYKGMNSSFDDIGNISPISLGRATHWDDEDFVGSIGDFKIFNYPLSQEEIAAEYAELSYIHTTGINITQTSLNLFAGGASQQLNAAVTPSDATDKSVTWTSSNEKVAAVSKNGLVTPISVGTSTITVKTRDGNFTAQCIVTVNKPHIAVTGISLNQSTITLDKNDTYKLTALVSPNNATDKSVTWSSSNDNVATVSDNGLVTAVSAGTAEITAKTNNGGFISQCNVIVRTNDSNINNSDNNDHKTVTDTITVNKPHAPSINIKTKFKVNNISVNKKITFAVSGNYNVKWSVSNTKIAAISQNGVLKAKRAGKVVVYAKVSGATSKYTIYIKPNKPRVRVKVNNANKSALIKYNKVRGATRYQIQLKKGKGKFKNIKTTNKKKFTIRKLKRGKYRIRVRAFYRSGNKKIFSAYSKNIKFKIK